MAKFGTITSDFPGSTAPSGFNPYGTWSVSGNKARFPITGSNYAGFVYYGQDLTASYVMMRVEPAAQGYTEMAIYVGGTYRARIQKVDGSSNINFRVGASGGGTNVTYNSTTMAWWQIREASGTTYLETSPDGTAGSWTTRVSATNSGALTSCDCDFGAGGGSATYESAFSKFNMIPSPSGTDITHTKPTVDARASSSVALGGITLTHTSPTADARAASTVGNAVVLGHTSPTATATAAAAAALGGLTLTHTSPTVTATASGPTAEVGSGTSLTHTKPTADVTASAGVSSSLALACVVTATAVAAGATVPGTLALTPSSPSVQARAGAGISFVVALTHTRPTATATIGQTLLRLQPVTHSRPTVDARAAAGVTQGALVLTLQGRPTIRGWEGEEPMVAWFGHEPITQYTTEEVSLAD